MAAVARLTRIGIASTLLIVGILWIVVIRRTPTALRAIRALRLLGRVSAITTIAAIPAVWCTWRIRRVGCARLAARRRIGLLVVPLPLPLSAWATHTTATGSVGHAATWRHSLAWLAVVSRWLMPTVSLLLVRGAAGLTLGARVRPIRLGRSLTRSLRTPTLGRLV